MRQFTISLLLVTFMICGGRLQAQEQKAMPEHKADHIMVFPSEITWKDGPGSLPAGAKFAVIEGDPAKPGLFTMRLRLPQNYQIRPHWHPADEHVTVISGAFNMGLGETFEEKKASEIPVGGFAVMITGTRHFAFTKVETIVQLHGQGPWAINYVKAADDPRKKGSN